MQLNDRVTQIKKQVKQTKSIQQLDELKCRKRVLRRSVMAAFPLDHITNEPQPGFLYG